MSIHIIVLVLLFGVIGAISVLAGVAIGLLGMGTGLLAWIGGGQGSGAFGALIAAMGSGFALLLIGHGLVGIITALGMMARKGWARVLGLILSALNVLSFSWWSLVGLYGLWALLSAKGSKYFERA